MLDMDRTLLWIWLTQRAALTRDRISLLCDYFDSIQDIYNAVYDDYIKIESLTHASVASLCNKSLDKAASVLEECDKYGIKVITADDDNFPKRIAGLPQPAYVMYYRGVLPDWEKLFAVAVIGTRRCSKYGESVCARLCAEMARKGITVVSGMAEGIDSYALSYALKAGGSVLAIMGRGLDEAYPAFNEGLMQQIIENGCAMSEYPPGAPPLKKHFPERNRLVAGIADAVIAVEAPRHSGTKITVDYAMNYGRKVFAVPGNIFNSCSVGTNNMLKNGALPMTCVEDLICEFQDKMRLIDTLPKEPPNKPKPQQESVSPPPEIDNSLSDEEKAVVELLIGGDRQFDEITVLTGLSAAQLNGILPIMEIEGIISKLAGNRYRYICD